MTSPRIRLGELLVRARLVTPQQLDEALAEQRQDGRRLGTLLVEKRLVTESQVTQILSQQLSVPWVSLHYVDFPADLLARVSKEVAVKYCLVPIYVRRVRGLGDTLYVAMDDPSDDTALAAVAASSGLHVRPMIAPPSDIRTALRQHYGVDQMPDFASAMAPALEELEDALQEEETGIYVREDAAPDAVEESGPASGRVPVSEHPLPEEVPGTAEAADAADGTDASLDAAVTRPSGEHPAAQASALLGEVAAPSPESAPRAARLAQASKSAPPSSSPGGRAAAPAGTPRSAARLGRPMALTLLDGTTIQMPSPKAAREASPALGQTSADGLVVALRALADTLEHGAKSADVSAERAVAALLALLLRKHLITDAELLAEYRRSSKG